MPFRETCAMEERILMLTEYDRGHWSVSELCRRHGISRETFHVWRARRASGEPDWFKDRSHATRACPHRTPSDKEEAIIAARRQFPHLGARKLLPVLQRRFGGTDWPAASTIGDILDRAGLVEKTRRRRSPLDPPRRVIAAEAANEEWAADFKGWFRTRDQQRIDPLTITDSATRFLIETRIAPQTVEGAQAVFTRAFEAYGLPQAIRCDNGAPFGSQGAGGLTRLSAWWLRLGIEPHFIRPASPQENGRHERMHRTLKAQTTRPPANDAEEQQARFDAFRRHYNEERPHEALGQTPPAEHYRPSPRAMPERLEDPWYDAFHQVRRVRDKGDIKWRGEHAFIGEALVGELVGLAELENGDHVVRFRDRDLGVLDRCGAFRRFAPPRTGLRKTAECAADQNLSGISTVQSVRDQSG
jgi:transposase InsO family protein